MDDSKKHAGLCPFRHQKWHFFHFCHHFPIGKISLKRCKLHHFLPFFYSMGKMGRQLNLKESFANANKRRRYSNENIASSALSSLPSVCSSTSSSTAVSPYTSLTSTSSFLSESISSATEPVISSIFQLQITASVSSPSQDSELSVLDEQNRTPSVFQSLSSNTIISTPSSIDMYDPNDIDELFTKYIFFPIKINNEK